MPHTQAPTPASAPSSPPAPSAQSPSTLPAPPSVSPSSRPAPPTESLSSPLVAPKPEPSTPAPAPSPVPQPTEAMAPAASPKPSPSPSPSPSPEPSGSSGPGFGSAVTYTPYNADQSCKSTSQVAADFEKISGYEVVRLYGTDCNQISNVIAATHSNVKLLLGIFNINAIQSEVQIISSVWRSSALFCLIIYPFLSCRTCFEMQTDASSSILLTRPVL